MKTYIVKRTSMGVRLAVEEDDRRYPITPEASLAVFPHSPDGFEMGYRGSGPAQLALAIILDFFTGTAPDPEALAVEHHQAFKEAFIAPAKGAVLEIEGDAITRWHGERIGLGAVAQEKEGA